MKVTLKSKENFLEFSIADTEYIGRVFTPSKNELKLKLGSKHDAVVLDVEVAKKFALLTLDKGLIEKRNKFALNEKLTQDLSNEKTPRRAHIELVKNDYVVTSLDDFGGLLIFQM